MSVKCVVPELCVLAFCCFILCFVTYVTYLPRRAALKELIVLMSAKDLIRVKNCIDLNWIISLLYVIFEIVSLIKVYS